MKRSLLLLAICMLGYPPLSIAQAVVVEGSVESTSGGFKYPDGTVQDTAAEDTNAATLCNPGEYLDGGGSCEDVRSRLDLLFAEVFARLVFITSETFSGAEVGGGFGATGADMHCQRLANAAGHQGRYLAWVSDDSTSPTTRFTPSVYPYRRVDGILIADDFSDLIDGTLSAPIVLDEYGVAQDNPAEGPWTGTLSSGVASADHCANWTGSGTGLTGAAHATGAEWTDNLLKVCGQSHRLYCFQQ